jgi:molybdopterin-synthase adenylyltransferase
MYPVNKPIFTIVNGAPVSNGVQIGNPSVFSYPEEEIEMESFSDGERYVRQILIFGEESQKRLRRSHVLIAGTGGLGSPIAYYLAAAGIGTITLIDYDRVTESNLNRQLLHWTTDIGREKILSAEEKLKALNPSIHIFTWNKKITKWNIASFAQGVDILIDAVDNFETRFILNEYAVQSGLPLIHGSVHGFSGQMMVIIPGKTPCLSCIFKQSSPESLVPVVGVTPGIIGVLQANEAIKYLTGVLPVTTGKLIVWDGEKTVLESFHVQKNEYCPVCGSKKTVRSDAR